MNSKSKQSGSDVSGENCYAIQNWLPEFGPQHQDPPGLHSNYKSLNPSYALEDRLP